MVLEYSPLIFIYSKQKSRFLHNFGAKINRGGVAHHQRMTIRYIDLANGMLISICVVCLCENRASCVCVYIKRAKKGSEPIFIKPTYSSSMGGARPSPAHIIPHIMGNFHHFTPAIVLTPTTSMRARKMIVFRQHAGWISDDGGAGPGGGQVCVIMLARGPVSTAHTSRACVLY